MAALAELPASPPRGMNGFAPEELPQRGADPAAAAAVSGAGSVSEVPAGLAPPGLAAGAAGSAGAAGAGGPGAGQLCCLREEGERCGRAAGNASFSKRIQKSISQKKLKLDIDKSVRHLYICDFHKNFIQSVRNKRKRKTSDDGGDSPEHEADVPEVDLFQLQVNTLRRYKRHYKLQTRPGLNKAQLAETVSRHFRNIPVNEKETLAYFIYMVKNNKSRLDQKSESSKQLE